MNCREFRESGLLESDAHGHAHLRECPACAAIHQREQQVAAGLHDLGAQWRRTQAPGRVERRLLAAFRTEMGVAPPPRRTRWFPILTWGVALAATVMVALLLMHPRQPQQTHRAPRGGMEIASSDAPYTVGVTAGLDENGFIPLPNAEQIDPGDEVDVVRMDMPRSTLLALGLPVGEDEGNVQADVLLGGDGVARAVRFLD